MHESLLQNANSSVKGRYGKKGAGGGKKWLNPSLYLPIRNVMIADKPMYVKLKVIKNIRYQTSLTNIIYMCVYMYMHSWNKIL